MLATIPLDLIENGQRLREISEAQVVALVNSIGDVGLLNPITVYPRKLFRGGNHVDGYGLVAGLHRKTACERLGLVEIEANILDLSDLECQIAECDENLCAAQLTPSDRARFTKRRKEAYEAIHGKGKAIGAAAAHAEMGHNYDATAKSAVAFTEDTAAKTGAAARTVRLDAERGEKIEDDALAAVRGTPLDTGTFLNTLKSVPRDEQVMTVREKLRQLRDKAKPAPSANKVKLDADIKQRAAKACAELIAEYVPADAWDHFKSNLAVTTSKDLLTEFTNITGQSIIRSAA
jgi:ParB family chromosome partitioning protein